MAYTFKDLIEETLSMLQGNMRSMDQATYLTSGVTSGVTSVPVADSTQMSRGLAEIDSELLWVDTAAGNVLTVPPYGRGYGGTTAAAHNSGTRVIFNPTFPRIRVAHAVNDTIRAVSPDLFAVASTSFTMQQPQLTYPLPAGTQAILDIAWQAAGNSQTWPRVRRWVLNQNANTTTWPTGVTVDIFDGVLPGRTVNVVVQKEATELVNETDGFASVSGLPESCRDVIIYGAAARLMAGVDAVRIAPQAVGGNLMDDKSAVGTAGQLSRQLYQMHAQRKQEERAKLLDNYPAFVHYQR